MSRPDASVLVPIADLSSAFYGLKIRTVGRLTSYKSHTGHGALTSGKATVVVDFSMASDSLSLGSLPIQSKLLVIGSVERATSGETAILIAIHIAAVDDLDIPLWEQAARELSRALHNRADKRIDNRR